MMVNDKRSDIAILELWCRSNLGTQYFPAARLVCGVLGTVIGLTRCVDGDPGK